jgi:hypothetical protein
MKIPCCLGTALTMLYFAGGALVTESALAQSTQSDSDSGKWEFAATIYGFIPTIDGTVTYAGDRRSSDFNLSKSDVINHLKMTFMGALDAHNGSWGIFNDVLYVDLGATNSLTRNFSVGNIELPVNATADLSLSLKATVWTVAGEYRVTSDPAWTVDLLAGARLLVLKPTLGYTLTGDLGPVALPGRSGSKSVSANLWDGIVGVKGRYAFGDERKWFVPFYLDVGAGQTQLTWQGAGGVGHAYGWGELVALYRYLDWNGQSGKSIQKLDLGGPMIGATFRW